MRVLINGGTGFVGRAVAAALLHHGHTVRVLSHGGRTDGLPASPRLEMVRGDVLDLPSLAAPLAGIDSVVHAVQFPGHPVENPRRGYTYDRFDGQGTENAATAARHAGVRRFVYLSGAGVGEGREEPWFRAKHRAEEAVRASGVMWTIFRPSWIYGPGDRSLNRFAGFARRLPFVPVIGDGKERVQPIYLRDLAEAVAASVDRASAAGRVFEAGGPETLTMNEIIRTMLRVLGIRKPLVHQPVWLMKAAAGILQALPNPPLSPAAIDFIRQEVPVDSHPMAETFAVRLHTLEEGLREYML